MATDPVSPPNPPPRRLKIAGVVLLLIATFALGLFCGEGQIRLFGLSNTSAQPSGVKFDQLWQVWNELNSRYDGSTDKQKELYGAMSGLVQSLGDPYSEFLDPADTKDFQNQLAGRVEGVGAEVGMRGSDIVVIAPISGSPAEKSGLKPGDVITAIDGKSIDSLTLSQSIALIRGKKGTKVTLTITRAGQSQDFTITRDVITTPSVTSRMERGAAYIKVAQFETSTGDDFDKALKSLLAQKPSGVIVDLRGDPGGYLETAIKIASEFLPNQAVVVRERSKYTSEIVRRASDSGQLKQGPKIVLLVDGGSASASEILAGALRDNGRAELIGEKTFGKGSVQDFQNLPGGSSLRLTIAHWFTPKGQGINHLGLKPDLTVPGSGSGDLQLDRAIQYLQTGK